MDKINYIQIGKFSRFRPDYFQRHKEEILNAIFGKEWIVNYKKVTIKKFARYEITADEIWRFVPMDVKHQAENNPDSKVFFFEDIYFTATHNRNDSYDMEFIYGIGVDPDKNTFFKPYEE